MKLREDIDTFLNTIPHDVTLICASKYIAKDEVEKLLEHHIFNLGENRVESFLEKYYFYQHKNIVWHFIGHLQRNKAKEVIDKIDYLHSLDSIKLAQMIDKQRTSPLKCFIEVSINEEENKNGVYLNELSKFIEEVLKLKNIKLVGFMMMAKANSSDEELKKQFSKLRIVQTEMEKKFNISLPYLSMGMSNDYKIAIECGATHIRLGKIMFQN